MSTTESTLSANTKEDFFLIGIGGTGMRCLEAFVHLCAMGLLDGKEIHLLALDTDRDNGNFDRLTKLVTYYNNIKGFNRNKETRTNTFFAAKINFYKFSPDYSTTQNYSFDRIMNMVNASKEHKDLANLFFSEEVQTFNLSHGYRAQTHLGSMLMYHSIIDEVLQNPDSPLWNFINQIYQSSERIDATKVFVLGSVFGGTGASSIPVIPQAFNKVLDLRNSKTLNKVYFGASLMTSYFTFREPAEEELKDKKVVASANSFALNSQAAMMFYEEDKTVKKTYQKFYLLGTNDPSYITKQNSNETITGGNAQKNDAHYLELFSAFAAYDFFNTHSHSLEEIKKSDAKYYYRSISENQQLDFKDFVKGQEIDHLKRLISCFTAMSFIVNLPDTDLFNQARTGALKDDNIEGYEAIHEQEVRALKDYFALFHFEIKETSIKEGWLRQVYKSIGGGNNLFFSPSLFGANTESELRKVKFHQLFTNKDYTKHNFNAGRFSGMINNSPAKAFDKFKKAFLKTEEVGNSNPIEKMIKRVYDTLMTLHNFQ